MDKIRNLWEVIPSEKKSYVEAKMVFSRTFFLRYNSFRSFLILPGCRTFWSEIFSFNRHFSQQCLYSADNFSSGYPLHSFIFYYLDFLPLSVTWFSSLPCLSISPFLLFSSVLFLIFCIPFNLFLYLPSTLWSYPYSLFSQYSFDILWHFNSIHFFDCPYSINFLHFHNSFDMLHSLQSPLSPPFFPWTSLLAYHSAFHFIASRLDFTVPPFLSWLFLLLWIMWPL